MYIEKLENEFTELKKDLTDSQEAAYRIIFEYISDNCADIEGLMENVNSEEKSFSECIDYILHCAADGVKSSCCVLTSDVVFNFAAEYYITSKYEEIKQKRQTVKNTYVSAGGILQPSTNAMVQKKHEFLGEEQSLF